MSNEVELLRAIENKLARVTVIGLGYVGLPVACMFARAGFQVTGLDVNAGKIEKINAAVSPIEGKEPGLAELLREVVQAGRLRATADYGVCRASDVVMIAVETPVDDESKKPHYEALRSALHNLGPNLKPGTLIVVESTIAPGTMQRVVKPTLEEASSLQEDDGLYLVHCPERLMPGKLLRNIETMSRVVGGMTPEASRLGIALYGHIVRGDLDASDALTAELVKTAENAYRDVEIAFANELALVCEAVGGDVWKVRDLVNKSPGRNVLLPGAGVGGHCIPKDPWLLVANAEASYVPRLIPAAREVNESMPLHVARLIEDLLDSHGQSLARARVIILGYSYLANSDDTRNSPSIQLVSHLRQLGAEVLVHDPFIPEYAVEVEKIARQADCLVLMVEHDCYRSLDWQLLRAVMRTPLFVDGRNLDGGDAASTAGILRRVVGKAF